MGLILGETLLSRDEIVPVLVHLARADGLLELEPPLRAASAAGTRRWCTLPDLAETHFRLYQRRLLRLKHYFSACFELLMIFSHCVIFPKFRLIFFIFSIVSTPYVQPNLELQACKLRGD